MTSQEKKKNTAVSSLLLFASLTASQFASAESFVTVRKQSEYMDVGTYYSTAVDGGSIQSQVSPGNRYEVRVLGTDGRELHTFSFMGPDGAPLEVGRYDNTSPAAAVPGYASLDYIYGNTGCSTGPPGYFIVREYENPASLNGVAHVAVDYFYRCGAFVDIRRPDTTFGSIRINSDIPAMEFPPWADGGLDIYVDEGDAVGLGAERSIPGDAPITGIRYRQLSGPLISVPANGPANFAAPTVPSSGTVLSFELELTNALGLTATDIVDVHVDRLDGRRTFIELQGEPGNYLLGASKTLKRYENGAYALIVAGGSVQQPGQLRIDFNPTGPGAPMNWGFMFQSPESEPMAIDTYENAAGFGSAASTQPAINVGGEGRGCNKESGRFIVRELDIDPALSTIKALALDFEQICEDRAAVLRGWIRLNSAIEVLHAEPTAIGTSSAGLVDVGDNVTVDASTSLAGGGTITSWQWRQIYGAPVTLVGANQPNASFVVPAVSAGDVLTFWVTITNSLGFTDTVEVPVVVRAPTVVTPPPPPATGGGGGAGGGGGGGGGAINPLTLLFLSILKLSQYARPRRS